MAVDVSLDGLERALALSVRMRDAAEQGAWDQVTRLEQERRAQLGHGHPSDIRCRPFFTAMLEHNRAVIARIRESQDALARELTKQHGRRQALGSYLSVIRGSLVP